MAYKTGLQVGVDGEKEFSNSIKAINSDVGLLNSELRAVTAEFGRNDKSIESLTAKSKIYNKEVDLQKTKVSLLTDQYAKQWDKLDKLYRNIEEVTKIYGENSKEVERAKKAYDDQEKSVKKLDSTLTVATSTLNKFEKQLKTTDDLLISQSSKWIGLGKSLDETGKKFDNVGNSLFKTGGIMTIGLTAPIMALGKTALTTGMDFESAMSRVKAISQATGDEFKKLNDLALKLGQDTAFSASEAAAGMENLASAGFSVDEILQAMPGMLDLAASGGLDVATASDIASSALRSFGLGADQSGHFADVLAKAAADTNANVTDMGMALKYAAAPANALGLSVEEVSAAIGVMADAGIKGEQAGTTLRGALLGLASPSGPAADAMAAIGMEVFDATGKMLPFKDVIAEVTESTKDLTEEEKVNALATIFGREAVSGMMVLIEKGPEKYDALTQSLISSDGAAKDMAETMQDNAKSSIEQMYGSLETAAIKIETAVAPTIIALSEGVQELADDFSNLDPEMQEMIIKSVLAVAAVGPLVMGIGAFAKIVGGTIGIVGTISGAIGVMTTGAVAATPAVAGLAGAMTVLTGPVGLVIAGLAALTAGGIILHNELSKGIKLTDEQTKANEEYVAGAKAVADSITTNITARTKSVKATQDEAVVAADLAKKIFDLADKQNKSAWEMQMLNGYVSEFNSLMPTANMVIDEQTGALNLTRDATNELIAAETQRIQLQAINEALVQNAKDQLATKREMNEAQIREIELQAEMAQGLQAIIDGKGNDAQKQQSTNELYAKYRPLLEETSASTETLTAKQADLNRENGTLNGLLKDPNGWNAYINGTNTAQTATVTFADGTKKTLTELGTSAPILATQAGTNTASGLSASLVSGTPGVTNSAIALHDTVKNTIDPLTPELSKTGVDSVTGFNGALSGGIPGITQSAVEMHRVVTQTTNPLPSELTNTGMGASAGLGAGFDANKPIVESSAQGLHDAAKSKMAPLPGIIRGYGEDSGQGYADGQSSKEGTIEGSSNSIVQKVLNAFKTGLGIASPSKEMKALGEYSMDGFLDGLSSNDVLSFCNNIVEDIKSAFANNKFSLTGAVEFIGSGAAEFFKSIGIGGATLSGLTAPVGGTVTSPYGYRTEPYEGFHTGIDIGAGMGTPVGAAGAGTVEYAGGDPGSGYGYHVILDHGNGLETLYGHLSEILVSVGQIVSAGQSIGLVGSTGNSTGPHLHFEIIQNGSTIDPGALFGFDVGSRYIPYDMPAMVHQGEMIIPKSENPYANSGGAVLPQQATSKQPAVIQVFLSGKQIAEEVFPDLNNMFGVKTGLAGRMQP